MFERLEAEGDEPKEKSPTADYEQAFGALHPRPKTGEGLRRFC